MTVVGPSAPSRRGGSLDDLATFGELIASLTRTVDGVVAHIDDDWMQGRTAYGGLTAALCFEAASVVVDDLPVRAAQISFIGPVAADTTFRAELIRRGRSAAFVGVDAIAGDETVSRCVFTFGAARPSQLDFAAIPMPEVPAPDDLPRRDPTPGGPTFLNHFDMRSAFGGSETAGNKADVGGWLRIRGEDTPATAATLLALADGPPPAAISMLPERVPLSSVTWMTEFLGDGIDDGTGWFFARAIAETAHDGYSSQAMTLWDEGGHPIMVGRQTVAIFD